MKGTDRKVSEKTTKPTTADIVGALARARITSQEATDLIEARLGKRSSVMRDITNRFDELLRQLV